MSNQFNAHLVSVPFGINGIEYYDEAVDHSNPGILTYRSRENPPPSAGAARGVMQLRTQQQENPGAIPIGTEPPLYIISLHQKGRLLVWSADTLEVLGVCDLRGCSVVQCVMTANYIFTRVESSVDQGSEEDWKIYVWDVRTFDLVRQLASHAGRVTYVVVSDQDDHCVATASVDHSIHIWNLNKSSVSPVHKLTGLGNATVLMYFSGVVLGGCTGAPFMAWSGETGEELFRAKSREGEGQVIVARWVKGYRPNIQSDTRHSPHTLLTGDCDGTVKAWSVDTSGMSDLKLSMSFKWARKMHRGPVRDLCGDGEVVLSYSVIDGACLCLMQGGKIVSLVKYSVRSAVLDTFSKSIIIGGEDGCVNVIKYEHWVKQLYDPELVLSFYPHLSSITGLLLQLREDHSWDRIICCGADGVIAFLDYNRKRGGRSITGMGTQVLEFAPVCGSIFYSKANGGITALNSKDMLPYDEQPQISQNVTAMRWSESTNTLIVGCEEGKIYLFKVTLKDNSPDFYMIAEHAVFSYYPRSFVLSDPDGSLVLATMQNNVLLHEAGFLVINLEEEVFSSTMQPVQNIRHGGGTIVTFKGHFIYDYTIILQLYDGSVLQYVGHLEPEARPVMIRTLVNSRRPESALEAAIPTSGSCNTVVSSSVSAGGTTNVKVTYGDGAAIKQLTFEASADTQVMRRNLERHDDNGNVKDTDVLVQLHPMMDYIVVVRESPDVDIITLDGEYLYRIAYGGDVSSYQALTQRRRTRTYSSESMLPGGSFSRPRQPLACLTNFCEERRYLAIGYRDGLVQLFDASQRVVFMRITSHNSTLSNLWAFPNVVISSTPTSACRANFVTRRVIFDAKESITALQSESISQP